MLSLASRLVYPLSTAPMLSLEQHFWMFWDLSIAHAVLTLRILIVPRSVTPILHQEFVLGFQGAKNVAMLYVVGPKGGSELSVGSRLVISSCYGGTGATGGQGPTVDSNAAFLQSVEEMAANALLAVAEYNSLLDEELGLRTQALSFGSLTVLWRRRCPESKKFSSATRL